MMKALSFFTSLLHYLPAELSHSLGMLSLKVLYKIGLTNFLFKKSIPKNKISPTRIKGKIFTEQVPNKLGFAAGLDKNGDYIDCLAALGIGFIEIGTVTPRPQRGNSRPRLFRDLKNKALINRMGFNNKGVEYLVNKVKTRRSNIPIGISIGKNFDTPLDLANTDYLFCLEKVYPYADYVAVNISSPNTEGLRSLSSEERLESLLSQLKHKQKALSELHSYKPIYIKLSPDESQEDLTAICKMIRESQIDGVICSNTSVDHHFNEGGGVSGEPLKQKSTDTIKLVRQKVGGDLPIIASGGVMNVEDYKEKIFAGADLVQIYTGFIYKGPILIDEILH